jgi:hypothetical protein
VACEAIYQRTKLITLRIVKIFARKFRPSTAKIKVLNTGLFREIYQNKIADFTVAVVIILWTESSPPD